MIKKRIFEIIQPCEGQDAASKAFDIVLTIVILLNVAAVFIDTLALPEWAMTVLAIFDIVSVVLFSIEYVLRIWTADLLYPEMGKAKSRFKYIFSFMGLIDLVAILPFYIPLFTNIDLRVLRLLRIFRLLTVFKLGHFSNGMKEIGDVLRARKDQLISSILVISVLIIIAAVLMYYAENEAQPDLYTDAFASLWWAVATLTTVGYGDIYPITVLGKILSAIIAILGVGLVAVPSGIISAGLMELLEKKHEKEPEPIQSKCPDCGAIIVADKIIDKDNSCR